MIGSLSTSRAWNLANLFHNWVRGKEISLKMRPKTKNYALYMRDLGGLFLNFYYIITGQRGNAQIKKINVNIMIKLKHETDLSMILVVMAFARGKNEENEGKYI
jgi:hypothetical protein